MKIIPLSVQQEVAKSVHLHLIPKTIEIHSSCNNCVWVFIKPHWYQRYLITWFNKVREQIQEDLTFTLQKHYTKINIRYTL